MKDKKIITKILHSKYPKKDAHSVLRIPLYEAAAFEYPNSESIENAFNGSVPGHVYSRASNPTVEYLEKIIKDITDAKGVIAVSSGMAAISNIMMGIVSSGKNIITSKYIFGNTYSLFSSTLPSFNINFKFTDLTNQKSIENEIDENTIAIFYETITNPQLEVADTQMLSNIAKKNNLLLIADTTLTPPYVFNSKKHGVDVEIISCTKYISGGGTSIGGLIIDNGIFNWNKIEKLKPFAEKFEDLALIAKLRKEVYRNFGACLSPNNAYLQILGLETMPLRIDRSCSNALELASWLKKHPKVTQINYPGLKSSSFNKTANKQFGNLYGGILTFDLESKEKCYDFMDKLELIRRATNMNDNKSLIIHPASTIYVEFTNENLEDLGVRDTMMRLSVGIEDIEDLKDDISTALQNI
ncbi:PLP-dependent transferase [Bacteroidota bacterium]